MKEQAHPISVEPRWPPALAILVALFVLTVMSARIRFFPSWFPYAIGIIPLLPMAGVRLSNANAWWLRIERITVQVFSVALETVNILALLYLIRNMLNNPAGFSGQQLLTSSVGGWIANVLAFSMVYWMLDRGGPEARANDAGPKPDWLFPQTGVPDEAPAGWRPVYVDYLFLSFSTAMAFSTTDTVPLTARAKMLMMLESAVALATLVIVASRAINILSS